MKTYSNSLSWFFFLNNLLVLLGGRWIVDWILIFIQSLKGTEEYVDRVYKKSPYIPYSHQNDESNQYCYDSSSCEDADLTVCPRNFYPLTTPNITIRLVDCDFRATGCIVNKKLTNTKRWSVMTPKK
jgi:hypothetical protein